MARGAGQYVAGTLSAVVSGQRDTLFLTLDLIVRGQAVGLFPGYGSTTFEAYDTIPGDVANARSRIYRSLGDRTLVGGTGDANLFYQLGLGQLNSLPGGYSGLHWAEAYQDWAISVGNGTSDSLSAQVLGHQTVTIAGANFNAALVGRIIWISGATNPLNNGPFLVFSFTSATTIVITNAVGVAQASFAGAAHYGLRSAENNTGPPFLSPGIDDGAQIDYFAERNQYEVIIVLIQSGSVYLMAMGSPVRNHIAPLHQGIGRLTAGPYAPGALSITVDRDLSATLQGTVGSPQRVWIYDATRNSGDALATDNSEIVFVTNVTGGGPSTITLQAPGLTSAKNANAMLGDDPSWMYHAISLGTAIPTFRGTQRADGTYLEGSNGASVIPQTNGITPLSNNPATGTGFFVGATSALIMANGPLSMRGNPQHWNFWPVGAQVDRDRMLPNFSVPNAQKFFKSLLNASFALAFGPGATTSP